ncbi:MAG: hypothetical protein ACLRY8_01765, partial [Clostridium butyricum]
IETTDFGVLVNPTLTFDERGHKKNEVVYGIMAVEENGERPQGYCPLVEEFIGEGGSFEVPETIILNKDFTVKSNENLKDLKQLEP